jgi:hypothetical protein
MAVLRSTAGGRAGRAAGARWRPAVGGMSLMVAGGLAVGGGYVIAGAGAPLSAGQHPLIIAYRLGATGRLPDTVGS